jgi:energy-converting hydrogenase Eha subunit B
MHCLVMCAFRSSIHYPVFVWIKKNLCYAPTYVGQFVTVLSIILIALLAANRFPI